MLRRRDLLLLPVLAAVPTVAGVPVVHGLRLCGPEPLDQLARLWCYGTPVRILVRPQPEWWPTRRALPDRWEAWLDLDGGAAVHVVAQGGSHRRPAHPVAAELGRLLAG